MSTEFQGSILKLLDLALLCRPSNPAEFAAIFFHDEQFQNSKIAHALHCLPFLENNPIKFREYCCVLFCSESKNCCEKYLATGVVGVDYLTKVIRILMGCFSSLIFQYINPSETLRFNEFEEVLKIGVSCLNFGNGLDCLLDEFDVSIISKDSCSMTILMAFLLEKYTNPDLIPKFGGQPLDYSVVANLIESQFNQLSVVDYRLMSRKTLVMEFCSQYINILISMRQN